MTGIKVGVILKSAENAEQDDLLVRRNVYE